MRLHTLTVEAFGPFVEAQEIDFDTLASGGLFLIHGATGAGKTSILDAVCFALFADVPGDRQARGLRSDLAPAEQPAVVSLDFTAGGRRLRITRRAEHQRPKKRGTGFVRVASSVALQERLGTDWRVVSTRIDESADIVHDLLGLGLAQFRRVALLPQGDFAAFLTASPEERRALLERLFDVTCFTDLEEWLSEQRRCLGQRALVQERFLAATVGQLTDLIATLPMAAASESRALVESGAAGPVLPADLTHMPLERWHQVGAEIGGALEHWAAERMTASSAAETVERQTAERLEEALERAGRRQRGQFASIELDRLAGESADVSRIRVRVESASRAQRAAGDLRRLQASSAEAERAADELRRVEEMLAAALPGRDRAASAGLPRLVGDLDRGNAHLAAAAHDVEAAREAATDNDTAQTALAVAQADHAASWVALRAWEVDVREAADAADAQAALAATCSDRAHRLELLVRLARMRDQLSAATAQEATADKRLLAAREGLLEAGQALLALEQARVSDLAAQLATGLVAGEPCPVCGSRSHPVPRSRGGTWSPELIAAASDRRTASEAAVEQRTSEHAAARMFRETRAEDVAATLAELGLDPSALGRLPDELAHARRAHAEAVQAASDLQLARETLAAADTEHARLTAQVADHELAAAAAGARAHALEQRHTNVVERAQAALAEHNRRCPCSAPAGPQARATAAAAASAAQHESRSTQDLAAALQAAHARHRRSATAAAAVGVARHQLDVVTAAHEQAGVALAKALATNGFTGRAELETALLSDADLATLAARARAHEQDVAVHRATLADPDVEAALADTAPVDPEHARATHEQARHTHLGIAREAAAAQRVATLAQGVLAHLAPAAATLMATRSHQLEITALADLVGGTGPDNLLRMRLSAFVLAARLERVVDLANDRLAHMGQGRFRLQHDDGRAARGARSGLGLVVFDEWSGVAREPASLSGGESFMASLALALGLAEAIREASGGFEVQTLFVDEGFGSLDEESLDTVMALLDALRDGGRAVGIVSHLADLRDRIPMRLQVHKSPHGSQARLITRVPPAA
ncbi:MAG: SMC family ATPase [Tetrasphaera sp.]